MNHLKTYRLFESNLSLEDIASDANIIFSDLDEHKVESKYKHTKHTTKEIEVDVSVVDEFAVVDIKTDFIITYDDWNYEIWDDIKDKYHRLLEYLDNSADVLIDYSVKNPEFIGWRDIDIKEYNYTNVSTGSYASLSGVVVFEVDPELPADFYRLIFKIKLK